jgi:hypothetical protein
LPPLETEYIRAFFFQHICRISIIPPSTAVHSTTKTCYFVLLLSTAIGLHMVPRASTLCGLTQFISFLFFIYFVQVFTQFTDFVQDKQTYTDILFQSQSPDIYTAFAAVLRTVGYGVHCHLRAWLPARSVGLPTSSLTCL